MIWHKCFQGDFPEDHNNLLNDERVIRVLAVDSSGEYSVELRVFEPKIDGYTWNSHKKNIEAWTEIDPYK